MDCQRGLPEEGEKEDLDEMVEMVSPPTREESGENERGMEGVETEGKDLLPQEQAVAGAPATDPEVSEEPEVLINPDPMNVPGGSADPENSIGNWSPPGQYRPSLAAGRLIPAGMEGLYVSTLTRRGRSWLGQDSPCPHM